VIQHLAMRAAATAAPRVPTRLGYRVAAGIGTAVHATARRRRAQLAANLRAVAGEVPEARLDHLTRMAFRNLVWNYYELFHLAGAGVERITPVPAIEGAERIREESARTGTGTIIVFAHVGNIEAFSQMSLLYPEERCLVVVEHMTDRRAFELLQRLRRSQGLELVRADEPRRLLRMLRDGWHVIIAGDLDTTGTGITVDLFGRPARMPVGPVKLALLTGASLVVAESWREDMDDPERFSARLSPPLTITGSGADPAAVRAGVEQVAGRIEKQIADRPEQWLAFRDVWEEPG
jgi:phosphatidylinositol dimannoside acyltransferase